MADGAQAVDLLTQRFGAAILEHGSFRDQHWAVVDPKAWRAVAAWLRDDPATRFNVLLDVTAVHWPDRELPIEIVAHLYSHERNDRLRLKCRVPDRGPKAGPDPVGRRIIHVMIGQTSRAIDRSIRPACAAILSALFPEKA